MGKSQRDGVIEDFIKLPGVSKGNANTLYDMGFHSLGELSKADANYLFRLGLNRQLASNIERIMDIWEDQGGKTPIEDAVAVFRGKKGRRRRGGSPPKTTASGTSKPAAESWGKAYSTNEPQGGKGVKDRQVLTSDGVVKNLQVCTVCKNLVKISDRGECPYCRDNPAIMPAEMMVTPEDENKERRKRLRRKVREVKRMLEHGEMDNLSLDKAWKAFSKAPDAFEEDDLDTCEKAIKKTIALVEMERMKRRKELDLMRRKMSGEIDDKDGVKWDLRNRGRLNLWYKWRAGLKSFVTPGSYEDTKYEKNPEVEHHKKILWTFAKITLVIVFLFFLFIATLVVFRFLETNFF